MFFLKELPTRRMIDGYVEQFPDADPGSIQDALVLMREASVLVRKIDTYFASRDFSQLRFLVLIVIDREPERTSLYANEIASSLDVSRPVASRTIRSLLDAGLVTAGTDDDDKRQKPISLTDEGRTRLHDMLPGYYAVITAFMNQRANPA